MSATESKEIKLVQEPIEQIEQIAAKLTPWEVSGKVNYLAQIKHFGTNAIDGKLIERWERVTKTKAHRFMRRGIVFSHQDIDKILDCVENGIPVFLYTGRGPSSDKMHLGHLVPFKLTAYLQKALNCIVIIQMSDDEKFLFKDGSGPIDLETYRKHSYSNARDIIACGFDLSKTLVFSNLECNSGNLYFNNVLIMKSTSMNNIKSIYGLGETLPENVINVLNEKLELEEKKEDKNTLLIDELKASIKKYSGTSSSSIGQCVWPAFQCGPAYCTSFKSIFINSIVNSLQTKGHTMPANVAANMKKAVKELKTFGATQSIMCLVPMAIDQAPYFRMARDVAHVLGCPKPAVIHSEFLPGLKQSHGKMSTTGAGVENSTLFLNMNPKDIAKTINSHAFSGGGDTLEEHKLYGGNIAVDIPYQYLTYFMDSDDELKSVAELYTSGNMTSRQIKKLAAELVSNEIAEHQKSLSLVTDETIASYFDWNRSFDIGGCYDVPDTVSLGLYTDYDNYGINFDRTFGYRSKPKPAKTS